MIANIWAGLTREPLAPVRQIAKQPQQVGDVWSGIATAPTEVHKRGRKRKEVSDTERMVAYLRTHGPTSCLHLSREFGWSADKVWGVSQSVRVRVVDYVSVASTTTRMVAMCASRPGVHQDAAGRSKNAKRIFSMLSERGPMTYEAISLATGLSGLAVRSVIGNRPALFSISRTKAPVPIVYQHCAVLDYAR